ncbi:hypothetical protein Q4566_05665 [Tamlana sp. 2_MG-2023]|uniref:hypothetical protein n=1 Tax=unclassified Tamlana TaxID=2614803 RepID=UPI0026E44B67|nr:MULTISPECIES: hypothetical protein [unclassified Tamlana]MDO6759681.1 hypothetical protein [Tamlana sp. 2_MG-2023]MDO6791304.1 hypothetical protein [Tamlana sp. 1_MG-2023]
MKKLVLTVAIVASGLSTFALTNPIMNNDAEVVVINESFKEISVNQLPSAVVSAVKQNFASATISNAYVNSSEQYKLTISMDGSENTVYADKDGNWLKEGDVAK